MIKVQQQTNVLGIERCQNRYCFYFFQVNERERKREREKRGRVKEGVREREEKRTIVLRERL